MNDDKPLILIRFVVTPAILGLAEKPKIPHISAILCHSLPDVKLTKRKQTTYENSKMAASWQHP